MASNPPPSTKRHISELASAKDRFLARVLDQAFDDGWRTAEDFLRHFSPKTIVESLAKADELRVKLLMGTVGAPERLALKKSLASAAEDLTLALEEEITTPAQILALYPPDDKVRYLPADALWAFYTEDGFFSTTTAGDKKQHARAAERMTFVLEVALDEKLLTLKDIADGITFDEIAKDLPIEDLREVVKHAMQLARADTPLTEERFHSVVPLRRLVGYVPLAHTWQEVVLAKVAEPAAFSEAAPAPAPSDVAASVEEASSASAAEEPPPLPEPAAPDDVSADPGSDRPAEEDAARRRVLDRLASIERLPPGAQDLPTPVLLSIESMYADLAESMSDDEREAVVEDAFPNQNHLRTAMLALIDLLDPSVDTNDPVIRDADVQSLVKIVLFEERRRSEPRRSTPAGSPPPSVPSTGSRRNMPPPVPRQTSASAPPAPPAKEARRKRAN